MLEKLGLGPDVLLGINPRIIVGRMTGFRRDGKYKDMAGHDINYIAVSGALAMLGRKGDKPLPPANILGDFAGGGATLYQGILLALIERGKSGKGRERRGRCVRLRRHCLREGGLRMVLYHDINSLFKGRDCGAGTWS